MDPTLKSSIDEVHQHVIDCVRAIVSTAVRGQGSYYGHRSEELLVFVEQLGKLAPAQVRPIWIDNLLQFKGKSLSCNVSENEAAPFLTYLLKNLADIEAPLLTLDEANFDFDKVFNEVREVEGIPETFELLIQKIGEIIAADLIDSRVVQEALDRLKAMLKRNKHGSLTSILVTLHYGRFMLKAFGGILSANKYLKPIVDSFKEEFSAAETKVKQAETKMKERVIRNLINRDRLEAYLTQNGSNISEVAGYLGDQVATPADNS